MGRGVVRHVDEPELEGESEVCAEPLDERACALVIGAAVEVEDFDRYVLVFVVQWRLLRRLFVSDALTR